MIFKNYRFKVEKLHSDASMENVEAVNWSETSGGWSSLNRSCKRRIYFHILKVTGDKLDPRLNNSNVNKMSPLFTSLAVLERSRRSETQVLLGRG